MIKRRTNLPAVTITADDLSSIGTWSRKLGLAKGRLTFDPNGVVLTGKAFDDSTVRFASYANKRTGFTEQVVSTADPLVSPAMRAREAKRMHKEGLTQHQIAERLGCSQKTISNDLRR